MFGAILGDIAGSRFEFDRGGLSKDFELVTKECDFTDDTVMTIAVAEALIDAGRDAADEVITDNLIRSMRKWGRRYPYAGYGSSFINWLFCDNSRPYNSYGNGSAMRVSSAGWLYDSLERTEQVAELTAIVSHNHSEGIKGAKCTAGVIYLGRNGYSKEYIKGYVKDRYGYDFSESLDEMRRRHRHVESCMDSLPKALRSFFDGMNIEDTIRNAVSLGGDTDTLACIAGSMAEGYFGFDERVVDTVFGVISDEMCGVCERFADYLGKI